VKRKVYTTRKGEPDQLGGGKKYRKDYLPWVTYITAGWTSRDRQLTGGREMGRTRQMRGRKGPNSENERKPLLQKAYPYQGGNIINFRIITLGGRKAGGATTGIDSGGLCGIARAFNRPV